MPIRTHRGRAAVYRRTWGWPLRSPRHLAATAAALTVLAVGLGITVPALGAGSGPSSRQPTSAEPSSYQLPVTTPADYATNNPADPSTEPSPGTGTSPTPTATGTRPTPTATGPRPPPGAAPAEAVTTASAFARAWAHHPPRMTAAQWAQRLRPYTTREYWPQLRTVDPVGVPASAVTGPPVVTDAGPTAIEVDVPTDALILRLTVVDTPAGWRVDSYTRAGG